MEPTIVSTSSGAIAIAYDYSPYLERIATSLELITESLNRIPAVFTTGTGILTTGINTSTMRETSGTVIVSIEHPHIPNGVKPTFSVVTIPGSTVTTNTVTSITILTPGTGYIHPPVVSITDNIGVVSTGTAILAKDISVFTQLVVSNQQLTELVDNVGILVTASTTTGIRTEAAYGWVAPVEMLSWYGQSLGLSTISTTGTNQLIGIINSLTSVVSKF